MNTAPSLKEFLEIDAKTLKGIVAYTFLALEGNRFYGGNFIKTLSTILKSYSLNLERGFIADNQIFLVARYKQFQPQTYYLCDVPRTNFTRKGKLISKNSAFEVIR